MAGYELATAYVNLVASSDSIPKSIARGMQAGQKVAGSEGKKSGQVFAKAFDSAKPIDLDDSVKKAAAQVEIASKKIKDARSAEEAAARKVQIEEAKLSELRDSGKAKASQILATEDRLAKAKSNSALASQKVRDATNQHASALAKADQANAALREEQKKTTAAVDRTADKFGGLKGRIKDAFSGNFKGAFASLPREADTAGKQVEREFDEAGDKSGSAFSNGIKKAIGAAAAYMSFDAVKSFLTEANEEARESQKVGALTAQTIKATGGAANVTADQVGNLAGAISEKAGMDDEAIQSGANMLLTFKNVRNEVGKGNDIFNRATEAATDLSAAGFGGVTDTSKQLGKALNDPIKGMSALGRSGVTFTKDQQTMIKGMVESGDVLGAQKMMLKEVESQVGGAAAASSTAGEKMAVTWGNFKETVGTAFLPIWDKLLKKMQPVVSSLGEKVGPAVESLGRIFAGIKDNIIPLTMVVGSLTTLWIAHSVAAWAASAGVTTLGGAFTALFVAISTGIRSIPVIGWIIAGIGLLVAALTWFFTKTKIGQQIWSTAWTAIKTAVAAVILWFQTYVIPVWNTVMNAIGTAASWLWNTLLKPVFTGLVLFWQTIIAPALRWLGALFKAIFAAIGAAVAWAWNTLLRPVFAALVAFWKNVLAPTINWLRGVFAAVFSLIGALIKFWWNTSVKPIFAALVAFWKNTIAPALRWLWASIFKPIFGWIGQKISQWWAGVKIIFQAVTNFLRKTLGPAFTWLKNNVISPVWNGIKSIISGVWAKIRDNVFNPLKNVVKNSLPAAFRAGRDAIGKAWNGLKALARKPVAFVIETILRDGLVKPFNKVAGVFGAKKIDTKPLTVPKLRTGGPVPGHSPTATADNIPIMATAGEFMVRRRSADRLRRQNPGALDYINKHGQIPGYKDGGDIVALGKVLRGIGVRVSEGPAPFGPIHRVHSKNSWHYRNGALDLNTAAGTSSGEMAFFDKLMPILHGLGWGTIWRYPNHYGHAHVDVGGRKLGNFKTGTVGGIASKGLMAALKGLRNVGGAVGDAMVDLNPFKGLVSKITKGVGETGIGKMVGSGGKMLVNKAVDWMTEKMPFGGDSSDINDPGGQGGGVGRWSDTVRKALTMLNQPTSGGMVNTVLRRMKQESGGNPRAQNNWDVNARRGDPSKGLMQVIGSTFRAYAMKGFNKNIFDPLSNILASMRYAIARYGSLSKAYNKRGGYAQGGTIVPEYDDGGLIHKGTQLIQHNKSKPDRVLTDQQWNNIYEAAKPSANEARPVINLTTPVVERNEVREWADSVEFAFTHLSKTSAFSGVNG